MSKVLYPEIEEFGTLRDAVKNELNRTGSALVVENDMLPSLVEINLYSRDASITYALNERLFLLEFWDKGIWLCRGGTSDFEAAVRSLDAWSTIDLRQNEFSDEYQFVTPKPIRKPISVLQAIENAWSDLYAWWIEEYPYMKDVLEQAYKDEKLKLLYPYPSHDRLCFSTCIGFPYTDDIPKIHCADNRDGRYFYFELNGETIKSESPSKIVELLAAALPDDIGPAGEGTAGQFV